MEPPGKGKILIADRSCQADGPPFSANVGTIAKPSVCNTHAIGVFRTVTIRRPILSLGPYICQCCRVAVSRSGEEDTAGQLHLLPRIRTVLSCVEWTCWIIDPGRLSISQRTVETHKHNIFRKLGINTTIELVRLMNSRKRL